jgi:hypothetical protein
VARHAPAARPVDKSPVSSPGFFIWLFLASNQKPRVEKPGAFLWVGKQALLVVFDKIIVQGEAKIFKKED